MRLELDAERGNRIGEIGFLADQQVVGDNVAAVDDAVALLIEGVEQIRYRASLPAGCERGPGQEYQ